MAKSANVTNEFGKAICEILGIDPDCVNEIRIHLKVGDVARLSIEGFWDMEFNEAFISKLKEYKIVLIEDD